MYGTAIVGYEFDLFRVQKNRNKDCKEEEEEEEDIDIDRNVTSYVLIAPLYVHEDIRSVKKFMVVAP
ncbi:hypothetical protein M0802_008836 [Mischocyttarus mexicanus]|nr:hypothetical protein M0802_008836 [Mischocyttarus mexicanus]